MVALSWGKGAGGGSAGPGGWHPGLACSARALCCFLLLHLPCVSPLCCGPCPGPGSPGELGAQSEVQEMPRPCLAWPPPRRLGTAPRLPDTGVVTAESTADQRGSDCWLGRWLLAHARVVLLREGPWQQGTIPGQAPEGRGCSASCGLCRWTCSPGGFGWLLAWGGNICPGALSTASLSQVLVIPLGGEWWQEGLPVRVTASWAAQPHPVAGVSSWSLAQVRWCDLAVWEMWSGEGTRVFG